jgi:uncharacterized membrane protein
MLVLDRRETYGRRPGMHALIVGAARYPYLSSRRDLQLPDLPSAATTALAIHHWLVHERYDPTVPLTTCRLLLSAQSEVLESIDVADRVSSASLQNLLVAAHELREDAGGHAENIVFVYLVGHGGRSLSTGQVFLTEDFGSPVGSLLHNAVDVSSLIDGLAISDARPEMARTQTFFLDMSRTTIPELEPYLLADQPTRLYDFDPWSAEPDRRAVSTFFAASLGEPAFARHNQLTPFGNAFLESLDGRAGELQATPSGREWVVTSRSLFNSIQHEMEKAYRSGFNRGVETVQASGTLGEGAPIHYLREPPRVNVTINVSPPELSEEVTFAITQADGSEVVRGNLGGDRTFFLSAGFYQVSASVQDRTVRQLFAASPPNSVIDVDVSIRAQVGAPMAGVGEPTRRGATEVTVGPVQLIVLGFNYPDFHGEIIAELERLRESDMVRVIDSLVVYKDADGELEVEHLSNLTKDEAIELGSKIGALIGLSIEGEEGAEADAIAADAEGADAEGGVHVFTEEEGWDVLEDIPNDSAAALILLEHHWAVPLQNAIARVGGFRISDGFISPLDLVAIGLMSADEAKQHHEMETTWASLRTEQ